MEKTPTIISDIARLTSRKFMVVLMFLSLRTTRQTSEFPSKFTTTMTEHKEITALLNMMTTIDAQWLMRKESFPVKERQNYWWGVFSIRQILFSYKPIGVKFKLFRKPVDRNLRRKKEKISQYSISVILTQT